MTIDPAALRIVAGVLLTIVGAWLIWDALRND
jgi:ABC-type nickel/cobalt efflux system permease component RcnA